MIRRIYRDADAVVAYGEHVRRFVARIRGRDDDVFVAPQSVEAELFGRAVGDDEIAAFRARYELGPGPLALYTGRLVTEKGIEVLIDAWPQVRADATLVLIGDGPLAARAAATPGARQLGALPRQELPVAYAAAELTLVPSIPTPRFREPWGLVCNEAMHQGRPVIATSSVGAVAGGLVQDERTGAGRARQATPQALALAADRLLADATCAHGWGSREAGRRRVHLRRDGAGFRPRADQPGEARQRAWALTDRPRTAPRGRVASRPRTRPSSRSAGRR